MNSLLKNPMSVLQPVLKAPEDKIAVMQKDFWSEYETPIVVYPLSFKLSAKDMYTSGFICVTQGSNYLYKTSFGKVVYVTQFHTLDIRKISLSSSKFVLQYDDPEKTMKFKCKEPTVVIHAIQTILEEATFGLSDTNFFKVDYLDHKTVLPVSPVIQRPSLALKWRALFLAHFYDILGADLDTIDYFEKWENRGAQPIIVLGPSFHPGNFGAAYGHALGWETKLRALAIQNNALKSFGRLLYGILSNTQTISQIIFLGYSGVKVPKYFNQTVLHTSVSQWVFQNCVPSIIDDWVKYSMYLPESSVKRIIINTPNPSIEWTSANFQTFFDDLQQSNTIVNGLTYLKISQKMQNFNFKLFTNFINFVDHLRVIWLSDIKKDMSDIYSTFSQSNTLQEIHLNRLTFHETTDATIPSNLLFLDVSESEFSEMAFLGLMKYTISSPTKIPIIFNANSIHVRREAYKLLQSIDFSKTYPNIGEISWSDNKSNADSTRFLFGYLFHQKNLQILSMKNVTPENQILFIQCVLTLLNTNKIPGLEISGVFEPIIYCQFLSSLVQAPWLKKLSLPNSKIGEQGLKCLLLLLPQLKNLVEFNYEGVESPVLQTNIDMLSLVLSSKNIIAFNPPSDDIKALSPELKMSPEIKNLFEKASELKRPPKQSKRLAYIQENANQKRFSFNNTIFEKVISSDIINDDDNYLTFVEKPNTQK